MSQFSRTLNISTEDLGGTSAVTLILTFDDHPMKGIYKDYFPVVWKLSTFPTKGNYAMTANYKNQLVVINPQVESNKVISAATWVKINHGEQTDLDENADSTKSFTTPASGEEKFLKVTNKTKTIQSIGVGFETGGTPPPTVLVFKEVGSTYNVTAQFNPVLSIYISSDYQEKQLIRGEVQTPRIWKKNLSELKETSNWVLKRDVNSGIYSLNSAPST